MKEKYETEIKKNIDISVRNKYGDNPDEIIVKRIDDEWEAMTRNRVFPDISAFLELTGWLNENGHPYCMRSVSGSSFILYLLGITAGNPLPPHRYCPKCRKVHWEPEFIDGFDIPLNRYCETDGFLLQPDGHDIPWQTVWGYDGFQPLLTIDLSPALLEPVHNEIIPYLAGKYDLGEYINNPHEDDTGRIELGNLGVSFTLGEDSDIPVTGNRASDTIVFRDDIFSYLIKHGFSEYDAWFGMTRVRKGRGLPTVTEEMLKSQDSWIISFCNDIEYLPPKAHAVEDILFKMPLIWNAFAAEV